MTLISPPPMVSVRRGESLDALEGLVELGQRSPIGRKRSFFTDQHSMPPPKLARSKPVCEPRAPVQRPREPPSAPSAFATLRHSGDVRAKHQQWQQSLKAALAHSSEETRELCGPATWLDPIESMLLLRQLLPHEVESLQPPAVAELVTGFRRKAEQLVFSNPMLRDALRQTGLR